MISYLFQMRQDQVEALVEDIFSRLDTNQDGVVTIDEFIEACQRVMKSLLLSSSDSFTKSVTTSLQIISTKMNAFVYINSTINKQTQFLKNS